MLKALLRKDFSRLLASLTTKKTKKGKKQSTGKGSIIAMLCLWIFIFISLGMAFAGFSHALGAALIPLQLDWLYYCLSSMSGFVLAILINGFMANSILFNAKDNDLLLSMPIPSRYILFSRMVEMWVLNLIYSLVVIVPAFVVRCVLINKFDAVNLVFCIVVLLLMSLSETAVSSVLGWVISVISKRVKNKSAVTVALSVIFFGGYYYFYFNVNKYIAKLVENSLFIGEKLESSVIALPVVKTGLALSGDISALIFCIVLTAALFGVVAYVLVKSFIKVATTSDKVIERKYDAAEQENVQLVSPKKALFRKELNKFTSSPTYMMNCGLGILFMIAAAVVLVIKKSFILETVNGLLIMMSGTYLADHFFSDIVPLACVLAIMLLMGTLDISAPSISLEGKNIWILQSLPTDPMDVFAAKQDLEFYLAIPPTVLLLLAFAYVFSIEISTLFLMLICILLFIKMHAALGVFFNLKMPKLDWGNEAVPIKQSLPVIIVLFGSWIIAMAIGAVYYFFLIEKVSAVAVIDVLIVVFALVTRYIRTWFAKKGTQIFKNL